MLKICCVFCAIERSVCFWVSAIYSCIRTIVPRCAICPVFHCSITRIHSVSHWSIFEIHPRINVRLGFENSSNFGKHFVIRRFCRFLSKIEQWRLHMVVASPRISNSLTLNLLPNYFSASVEGESPINIMILEYLKYSPWTNWWKSFGISFPVVREVSISVYVVPKISFFLSSIVEVTLSIGSWSHYYLSLPIDF